MVKWWARVRVGIAGRGCASCWSGVGHSLNPYVPFVAFDLPPGLTPVCAPCPWSVVPKLTRLRTPHLVVPAGFPSLNRRSFSPTRVWKLIPFRLTQNRNPEPRHKHSVNVFALLNTSNPTTGGCQTLGPFPNRNAGFVTRSVVPLPWYGDLQRVIHCTGSPAPAWFCSFNKAVCRGCTNGVQG